jgi:Ca2+-binding RTX toxin-like protein
MPLSIIESLTTNGAPGTDGANGTNGTDTVPNGGAGGIGQPGTSVLLGRTGLTLLGDGGGDNISIELQANGGRSGSGGGGGTGKSSSATVTFTNSPGSSLTEAVYGATGAGGAGGSAGSAGIAEVSYTNLDIDMAGSLGTQNSLRLWGVAWGGNGGNGGTSGGGGSSGYTGLTSSTTLGPPPFTTTSSQLGTPGGAAPDGAAGAAGATATVRFDDISVVGENNLVSFYGTVIGGSGGSGGSGSRGGSGSTGASGGNGGDGGDGALGLAEATRLDVQATGGLNLTIYLDARGGQGNQGGGGGNAGSGQTINGNFTNGVGSTLNTTVYAANGRGGDGGDGGDGVARLADSAITGSSVTDNILLFMRAAGGLSGPAVAGAAAVASSNTTSGNTTTIVQGTPAGQRGTDGTAGDARIEITNTTISLGDGADRLEFDLLASGPGTNQVIVAGNSLDGGDGIDRLLLGTGKLNEPGAVVNLALGLFGFGTGPLGNTITGFEQFDGTAAADLFTGGAGGQSFALRGGNDTFLGGTGAESVNGGDDDDSLQGGGGNDTLLGGGGADTLVSGLGADSLVGGAGNDLFVADGLDTIVEASGGGTDTVRSATSIVLPAEIEVLELVGTLNANATGNALGNLIIGNAGNNRLSGDAGDDTILGQAGADTLTGGPGADSLVGGADNDLYVIDADDKIVELPGGGIDTVQTAGPAALSIEYILAPEIEALVLTGTLAFNGTGNALDNLIIGNTGNNQLIGEGGADTIVGGLGADTLIGGAGDDLLVADAIDQIVEAPGGGTDTVHSAGSHILADHVEVLELTGALNVTGTGNGLANTIIGNTGANRLIGAIGNDTLLGGAGADTLIGSQGADSLVGGADNDLYVVDIIDRVVELAGGGIDTVQSAGNHTLANEVEVLHLTGALNVNGTGNGLANTIMGNVGNNQLNGASGNDTLLGGAGADTLTGSQGADSLVGGTDNDLYVIDAIDSILELAGGGIDTVRSAGSHALANEVEALELTGAFNVTGTGNALANTITGNTGNNALAGEGGNDTLLGGAGADTLTGGQGADSLVGGADNDLYLVDIIDRVVELAGGGFDTVRSAGSHTLAAEIEALELTGALDAAGTGNAVANTITGNAGNNQLNGAIGNDTLLGGAGADTLIGAQGADSLVGGADNDLYVIDAIDSILELAGGGTDTVRSAGSHTLANEVEALELTGALNVNGTGNTGANLITGNAGNNILSGGFGADTLAGGEGRDTLAGGAGLDSLVGGAGEDVFRFDFAIQGADVVADFNAADDQVAIRAGGFGGGLFAGIDLAATGRFVANAGGTTTSAAGIGQVVFNTTTGQLLWDFDGIGTGASVVFATLTGVGAGGLTAADVTVFA